MNKVPGFSAEASLYRTKGHYHMVRIVNQAEATIQPEQFLFISRRDLWSVIGIRILKLLQPCDYNRYRESFCDCLNRSGCTCKNYRPVPGCKPGIVTGCFRDAQADSGCWDWL